LCIEMPLRVRTFGPEYIWTYLRNKVFLLQKKQVIDFA
jgi:hypothetical protein